ncbi:MAG: DUF805 domain-containing protein [Candidatus Paralactobacillus gallistercoris]|uniref:DUF805 domain-containing protein n=1 Tax=Candidatus Paralactobacillus gallistercoris TaxID=2838724 RepID=A0A948TJI2_9LACO|nr:DUF805 domain-containing protein [Candidatus Paralactobacillus gallistercoris]
MHKVHEHGRTKLFQAWLDFFKGYVDFKGNTTRSGYWWGFLLQTILLLLAKLIATKAHMMSYSAGNDAPSVKILSFVGTLIVILLILPMLTLSIRRYRDIGLKNISIIIFILMPLVLQGIALSLQSFITINNYSTFLTIFNVLAFIKQLFTIIDVIFLLLPSNAMTLEKQNRWVRSK